MRTRLPSDAKSTDLMLRSIFPESFKFVNDKTSNGYKYVNMLFGVEVDQARTFIQEVYSNSFLPTMDFGTEDTIYEVYLSGLTENQYLNPSGIRIKITNNGRPGGDSEFWDGDPTRVVPVGVYDISGIVTSGHITGLQYFRLNPSGYGYFLVSTDIEQSEYLNSSGSTWRIDVNTTGAILSYSGSWPGVNTQSYDVLGEDEVLTPLGSGYLSKKYPLTRRILDDSGVYWNINHYEPSQGWSRDPYGNVVATVAYLGDFYYDGEGVKIYYRSAFNNPYGSGNYTTEYLPLKHVPISGTLKVYDLDILDISGNATEIPSTGKDLYKLKSDWMLEGTGVVPVDDPNHPQYLGFDPIYVGYSATVPNVSNYGHIAGSGANLLLTTSWNYQHDESYLDEGTMTYVEGSGELTNAIKITNPYSRYLVEYKYKVFSETVCITSMSASRYISFDTINPVWSVRANNNNTTELPYEFTRDPGKSKEKAKYITFDGWTTRPGSKISSVDFNLPLHIGSGLSSLGAFQTREQYIGYSNEFVPLIHRPVGTYVVLDCPFDNVVVSGVCTEDDLSGSGNTLTWLNTGTNVLLRSVVDGSYGKTVRYVNNSGYFYKNSVNMITDNTFFSFDFRLFNKSTVTLMELSQATDKYIKVQILEDGMLQITSNGTQIQSKYRFLFDDKPKGLIINVKPDQEYTNNLIFTVYIKDAESYVKQTIFVRDIAKTVISSTYLHVAQNSTFDIKNFKIWQEVF